MNYLFASTNFGTEKLLEKELLQLGCTDLNTIKGGIYYQSSDLLLYQSLMWSRIASRIFLCIKKFQIKTVNDLYQNIYTINWNKIFDIKSSFVINFKGTNNIIRNSLFGSLVIKDAIVDQFNQYYSCRPNVDLVNPDIRIKSFLTNNEIRVMLDLSGDALHKRGYRKFYNTSPMKENLAAAIVLNSGWKKNIPMIDPMCGSGTLLIEAAMISSDRAPGLKREKWGFKSWKKYNSNLWDYVIQEAEKRFEIGKKIYFKNCFIGYDYNSKIIEQAKKNALKAGILNFINFSVRDINNLKNFYHSQDTGLILSNPPYGERFKTEAQLVALYVQIGMASKKNFEHWKLSIVSSSHFLLTFLQMTSYEEFLLKNGPLDCIQKNYEIFYKKRHNKNYEFKNRLIKNFKKIKKWTDVNNIECFQVYHSDLPNYKVVIDIYKNWVVIQEYKAPNIINYHKSHKRLCDAIYYTKEILSVPINNIVLKIRQIKKNKTQYQRLFNSNTFFEVQEYHAKFLINVIDYLDTGLFLDKRCLRKLLGEMSKGKDFLNLFAYTGTASVYAGLGQAKSTTTVDISNTYIKWSMHNMSINNLTGSQHAFIQDNCLNWVKIVNKKFDLIFINPPTFSNSKKMKKTFELNRDYLNLIVDLKKILRKNGCIIFSSSMRNFEINYKSLNAIKLQAKNITKTVQTKDCLKNSSNYYSWLIKHIL